MAMTSNGEIRRVMVTGARGALGSEVVSRFLREQVEVVGVDLGLAPKLRREEGRPGLSWLGFDASDADGVRGGFAAIEASGGPIDVVIHCAGGFRWSPIEAIGDKDLDFLLSANLRSSLLIVRQAMGSMKARGFGRVILISSRSTLGPGPGEGAYAATKAGINALVQACAREVAEQDVTINAVLPSILDTPANRQEMPQAAHDTWVRLEDLAQIIFDLTRPAAGAINGALIPVSGRT